MNDGTKNDGGPAFPQPCTEGGYAANSPYNIAGGGMTLRDWFAGVALQGLLSGGAARRDNKLVDADGNFARLENAAYGFADAMLAARDSKQH
jgi:hypothetical protein